MLTSSPLPLPFVAINGRNGRTSPLFNPAFKPHPSPSHAVPLNPHLLLSVLPQNSQAESPEAARIRARRDAGPPPPSTTVPVNADRPEPSHHPLPFPFVRAHHFDTIWCSFSQQPDEFIHNRARPPPCPTPARNWRSIRALRHRPPCHRLCLDLLSSTV